MNPFDRLKGWFTGSNRPIPVTSHDLGEKLHWEGPTFSGQRVTENTCLSIDAVWACVRMLSQTIGTLPLHLYRTGSDGFGAIDGGNRLYSVLHDKPNDNMTGVLFWTAAAARVALRGNHYSRVFRNNQGQVTSIIPFKYQDLIGIEETAQGELLYTYSALPGEVFREKDVFHLKGFSFDGKVGLSALEYARQSFGNALAVNESTGRVFSNGLQASGLITAEEELTDEQVRQVHERLVEHKVNNRGGTVVLPAKLRYAALSMNPEDAQMLETRAFTVEEVCRWFGVPPVLIGHMTKSTSWGSGIEQLNLFFLQYGLRPYLSSFEAEIKKNLLKPEERLRCYAKFNVEGLLRGDSKGRSEYIKNSILGGYMTPNEGRAKEDLPPKPGGDDLLMQTSYAPLTKLGEIASKGETNATENP